MTARNAAGVFPWRALMRAGMGRLRIAPEAFWRMTPRELAAALDGEAGRNGEPAMPRAAFEALMARFPDSSVDGGYNDP